MLTVNHFMNEKVAKRNHTYNIIKRAENGLTAKRELVSVRIAEKMNKKVQKDY